MIRKFLLGVGAAFFSCAVFAADAPSIAFVDGTVIMQKFEPGIEEKLRSELKGQQDSLAALQKTLVDKSETYARDSAIMSDAEKLAFQQDFEKKQMEFQKQSAEFNQKRVARSNEELEKLLAKVKEAVTKIAEDKKYDMVLQLGAAIYVDEALDITDDVLAKLDKK